MSILKNKLLSGVIGEPQKLVIYGPEKIGKSTLAMQMPKPLFLDTEKGSRRLPVDRVPVETLAEFDAIMADPALTDYETVVVDTIDWLESRMAEALCEEKRVKTIEDIGGGYGKGYVALGERMLRILTSLSELPAKGCNVVLLGHSIVSRFEAPEQLKAFDRYELDLNKKHVAPLLKHWADMILFLNWKTRVKEGEGFDTNKGLGGKERLLFCNHTAAFDAGNRHGLADEEPATIDTIRKAFAAVNAPWGRVNEQTAKVAAVAEKVKKVAGPVNGGKPSPKVSPAADAAPGEPASGRFLPHETKPQANPSPKPDYDGVPGEPPENGGPVKHPLEDIIGDKVEAVNAFLRARREITPLQTFRDLGEKYVAKVLKNPAGFLAVACPIKIGGVA